MINGISLFDGQAFDAKTFEVLKCVTWPREWKIGKQ